MPIEQSDVGCPECGEPMQVMYVTEHRQVIAGYACPECGFAASEKDGEQSVALSEDKEYILRIERPLSTDDIENPLDDIEDEFRTRAREKIADEEVWLLIDPEKDDVVDFVTGDSFPADDDH